MTTKHSWAIGTYLRIRPTEPEFPLIEYQIQHVNVSETVKRALVELKIPFDADPGLVHNNSATGTLRFEFDEVFGSLASQDAVFNEVASRGVVDAIGGINSTIFAYGQTSSGKTYSIFGGDSFRERGLIPRAISLAFEQLQQRKQNLDLHLQYKCTVSFTEIYKESVYDLLDEEQRRSPPEQWATVQVFEAEQGIILRNLNVFEVNSEDEALQLFFLGSKHRTASSTAMNLFSSRSHAIFTLLIETESVQDSRKVYTSGKINLVDLAGSERMYKLQNTAESIKEAKAINLSLHFLEQVILCLRDQAQEKGQGLGGNRAAQSTSFVPYRNSVLTNMLRDSLGGNCRSAFLLTMSAERRHFEESVATCRFGARCGEVKVTVTPNSEIGLSDQLKDMAAKLKAVEKQLAVSEEKARGLEHMLGQERLQRTQETQLRALTAEEKNQCRDCVQELLNSARSFVEAQEQIDSSDLSKVSRIKEQSEQLIEKSQDDLYKAVEHMDKAVLVELGTALGGLVQSVFIEHQLTKREQRQSLTQEQQRLAAEQMNREQEHRLLDILRHSDDVRLLPRLPQHIAAALMKGAIFSKRDRLGRETLRRVFVSNDLTLISWHSLGGEKEADDGSHSVQLSGFQSVEYEDKALLSGQGFMTLRPRAGSHNKMLSLKLVELWNAAPQATAVDWAKALAYLILKAPSPS